MFEDLLGLMLRLLVLKLKMLLWLISSGWTAKGGRAWSEVEEPFLFLVIICNYKVKEIGTINVKTSQTTEDGE